MKIERNDLKIMKIRRNDLFIKDMISNLTEFYEKYFKAAVMEKHVYKHHDKLFS